MRRCSWAKLQPATARLGIIHLIRRHWKSIAWSNRLVLVFIRSMSDVALFSTCVEKGNERLKFDTTSTHIRNLRGTEKSALFMAAFAISSVTAMNSRWKIVCNSKYWAKKKGDLFHEMTFRSETKSWIINTGRGEGNVAKKPTELSGEMWRKWLKKWNTDFFFDDHQSDSAAQDAKARNWMKSEKIISTCCFLLCPPSPNRNTSLPLLFHCWQKTPNKKKN